MLIVLTFPNKISRLAEQTIHSLQVFIVMAHFSELYSYICKCELYFIIFDTHHEVEYDIALYRNTVTPKPLYNVGNLQVKHR